jgi:ATP-dependent Clp protease ATP-binding subunit ClpX
VNGPRCSFCGKAQSEVRSIVAGGPAFICNECVTDAVEIIGSEHPEWLEDHAAFVTDLKRQLGPARE